VWGSGKMAMERGIKAGTEGWRGFGFVTRSSAGGVVGQ
jgi:hypothetical protein